MNDGDLTSLLITAQLASITTIILALIGTPLAWWLARTSNPIRVLVEPIVALPIVLPPTVLGFYFLMAFSPDNFLGNLWILLTGSPLAFTFLPWLLVQFFTPCPSMCSHYKLHSKMLNKVFWMLPQHWVQATWTVSFRLSYPYPGADSWSPPASHSHTQLVNSVSS